MHAYLHMHASTYITYCSNIQSVLHHAVMKTITVIN